MGRLLRFVNRMGDWVVSLCRTVFDVTGLFYDILTVLFVGGRQGIASSFKQIVSQVLFTGVEAFWLVGVIGLLCGITIIIQAMTNMPKFGVGEYFGNILIIVVIRELGPFFTSLVVVGRSGSALATYIGNMRVSKELSALEVMGIDPVHFIVMPAFVGMVISMVCLSVYFDIIAIIGGYFIAQVKVSDPVQVLYEHGARRAAPVGHHRIGLQERDVRRDHRAGELPLRPCGHQHARVAAGRAQERGELHDRDALDQHSDNGERIFVFVMRDKTRITLKARGTRRRMR